MLEFINIYVTGMRLHKAISIMTGLTQPVGTAIKMLGRGQVRF